MITLAPECLAAFSVVSDRNHYQSESYRQATTDQLLSVWPVKWSVHEVAVDLFRAGELRVGRYAFKTSPSVIAWLLVDGEPARFCRDFTPWADSFVQRSG